MRYGTRPAGAGRVFFILTYPEFLKIEEQMVPTPSCKQYVLSILDVTVSRLHPAFQHISINQEHLPYMYLICQFHMH